MGLAERLKELPTGPGVYLFKSLHGRVLYIGKAQNLRSRVGSYLKRGGDGRITVPRLLERAVDVDVVLTANVKDALLLENELIKKHRPPFNVRLRDDKQYLALRLDPREDWPRLTQVRRFRRDGALYFGPYTSSGAMREAVSNLRRIFPLRSCTDPVFRDYRRRGRPCIEYEMKRCAGPCCDLVEADAYRELVDGTILFLKGRSEELVDLLDRRMEAAARNEQFEDAARLRDRMAAVQQTLERQQIVTERPIDRDVFGLARRGSEVEVQVLHVREGRVVGGAGYGFSDVRLDGADVLSSFLGQYYGGVEEREIPDELLTPESIDDDGALEALLADRGQRRVVVRAPKRGAGRELVAMARANAELGLERRLHARESVDSALEELREQLGLSRLPRRIECYDVSHLHGVLTVASRVVFEDGRPDKSGYRRYRLRHVADGDDYAAIREVIQRRILRIDRDPLADLVMVDGGKGQLGVLRTAFRDAGIEADLLGLAKERDPGPEPPSRTADPRTPRVRRSGGLKAERIFLPERKDPVLLPPSSRALLLLQRVRDESHRFAIEYQRKLRGRTGLTSILEELPGIGPGKRRALLRSLGSLRAVRDASLEQLAGVPGISERDAETIHRFFEATRAAEVAAPE